MDSVLNIRIVLAGLLFFSIPIFGIEEKDWKNTWPTEPLQGTEKLTPVEPQEIAKCSVSITYALDRGRFGDQLANYIKAMWICWKYNLPMIYRPFDYSDQLMLSSLHETHLNEKTLSLFSKKVEFIHSIEKARAVFDQLPKSDSQNDDRLLCIISFLTPLDEVWDDEKWDDVEFRKILCEFIKPRNAIELLELPKQCVTVALHVRTGRGYDWQLNIDNMPTKFPPDTFYLNSLKQVANHFKGQSLYVRIFTDDPEPTLIRDRLSNELQKWGIEGEVLMDCRLSKNNHDLNVLEDFFSMMQCDCIIHPDSNLSRCAAGISAPILEVKPSNWDEYRKEKDGRPLKDKNGKFIVDSQVIYRSTKGGNIMQRSFSKIESKMLF